MVNLAFSEKKNSLDEGYGFAGCGKSIATKGTQALKPHVSNSGLARLSCLLRASL